MSRDKRDKPLRYNARMIRDFLEHLEWEIRISLFECLNPGCKTNPELVDMLKKYLNRYNACLRTLKVLDRIPGQSDEELQQAIRARCGAEIPNLAKALEAMETLKPFFEEAFFCISCKGSLPVVHSPASPPTHDEDVPADPTTLRQEIVPIDALFDTEGNGPNLETDYRQRLHDAKVILGVDTMSGRKFIVFGKDCLLRILANPKGESVPMIFIGLDEDTDELERLLALVTVIKGHHDYGDPPQ
jgi:hypothetical protein